MLAVDPTLLLVLGLWGPQDDDGGPLRVPGLVARYRAAGVEAVRVDPKPAFSWGASSPHPRLPDGPFEVEWSGWIHLRETEPVRFSAALSGELELQIDGARVALGQPFQRPLGLHPLRVRFRSRAGEPARVQLWWESSAFAREPLPARRLSHDPAAVPEAARLEEAGRTAAARLGCARCHRLPGLVEPPPGPSLAGPGGRSLEGHAPELFAPGRRGLVERALIEEALPAAPAAPPADGGDHRRGRNAFITTGCIACHGLPDADPAAFRALAARYSSSTLAAFLVDPAARYPDGRMPSLRLDAKPARDIAAFLLLWSRPPPDAAAVVPTGDERRAAGDAAALIRRHRCGACHEGLGPAPAADLPIADPSRDCAGPRFALDAPTRRALAAYLAVAPREHPPSPFVAGQRLLQRRACTRCHARDSDEPAPLEAVGSSLGGSQLERLAYQRVPRLSAAHWKYTPGFLRDSVREGAPRARASWYSYRMPAYGDEADVLVRALAEGDGDVPEEEPAHALDPTLASVGPTLVGFGGYSCVSCHLWGGKELAEVAPGSAGPELSTVTRRVRRAWFDAWLESPLRLHPGTPMPAIFPRGEPASIRSVLEGDAARQRDALWGYLALGRDAPAPRPFPPAPVAPPVTAQIPVHLPGGRAVEAIALLTESHDLLVYDVAARAPAALLTGARLLRTVSGRVRGFRAEGRPVAGPATDAWRSGDFLGYDRLSDGVRLRWRDGDETLRWAGRELRREAGGRRASIALGPAAEPAPIEPAARVDAQPDGGSLQRPGYRASLVARPKTASGEDRLMPGAVAVDPKSGRVYAWSMKTGELFAWDGRQLREWTGGLFEEAYAMAHDGEALWILHRRNLTRARDTDGDGRADAFDRLAALPHGTADTYDYAYGLVPRPDGGFVTSFAPYANRKIAGSGGAVRLRPGPPGTFEEIAYGMRNPLGWCAGPDGEVFFTDNQGEWVATNRLCHVAPGRYYGFPNPEQAEHARKPAGPTAVWVPYAWARSINGVAYDATNGGFGPFAGQFFLAELMYGGAIVRACVERVDGEFQGACFPFWGRGLVGPLAPAFDPRGPLYVGSITEPGWMSQPDRGALFRIDYTGPVPFEILSIHARPRGFRLVFTKPVAPAAANPSSYALEHYRYETTGAYGSPELDRASVPVREARVAPDGLSVELTVDALVAGRVWRIRAEGVTDAEGGRLVHPEGAYTLNRIPAR